MGGTIVLSLALRNRPAAASLVVLSPLILPFRPPGPLLWHTGHALSRIVPRFPFWARLPDSVLTHDPQQIEAMGHDALRHKRITARLAVEMFREGRWLTSQGPHVQYPLLLMHGTADLVTSFQATRQFAESIPNGRCTFRAWPGLYHELFNEAERQQVVGAIVRYLQEILPDCPHDPGA
jgi:alpha-beta hydrolase superfamily lysophospholipase